MGEKTPREKTVALQYTELNKFGQNGEFERAIKAANKILGVAPHEFEAFQCKIVCLINLNKFEEAVQLMNKKPEHNESLLFEKAYCYYRLNNHEESLKTLEKAQEQDGRMKELKAQIMYRLENYKETAELYQDIIKNCHDDYEDERYTNLSAVMVQLKDDEMSKNADSIKDNTYELCFNRACLLIARELYAEAEKKLKHCEKLCLEMFEDEESEEEIDVELALIRIQLAYVYQKQGRLKEAQQLYAATLRIKLEDIALVAVASNNIVCINKDQNLFDSKKKMKAALNDQLKHKMPSEHRKCVALNNAILHYYLNQNEQCDKFCSDIDNIWPELSMQTNILRTLNLIKCNKTKQAVELLKNFKSDNSNDELFVKLTIAQLQLAEGNKIEATKVLEKLGEATYKPAIVGALTTLYLGMGDEEKALRVFEKSVDWYKKNKVKGDLTNMWRQAADFHIRNGHPQVAANSLEEILKINKDDKKTTAQLVLACSQFDKRRALELSKNLPTVKELSQGIDINAIQSISNVISSIKKSPGQIQESQPSTPRSDKKRKHKKRKGKLPKNYDSSVAPDPERWLPKYERTGYRKKRDRRAKDIIKGSQGTASGQSDQYDFSKHVAEHPEEVLRVVEPSPRGHAQHKKQQKKKGKRR